MAVAPTGLLLASPLVYVMVPLDIAGILSEHVTEVGATVRGDKGYEDNETDERVVMVSRTYEDEHVHTCWLT